jgi:hypothetical protein
MRWCARCDNCRWVCENHPHLPWEGPRACGCGGAGDPCPICNRGDSSDPNDVPEMPADFVPKARRND